MNLLLILPFQLPWTRFLLNDTVASLSIKTAYYDVTTGANLTVQCTVVRWCLAPFVEQCRQPTTVRWFTPRLLVNSGDENHPRKEITFSSKVVSSFHRPNISGEISVVQITSTLQLNAIGFIHAGYYECSSFIESQDFTLNVAENSAHSCTFGDQCSSGNCGEGACRCSGPQFNWVPATKSCVKRVPMGGGGCTSDAECQLGGGSLQALMPINGFAQHLAPIRCLANGTTSNSCQCDPTKDVRVAVAVAEVDVCLPRAYLGATCYSSAQCTATTGAGAFCGLNLKTIGKNSSSAEKHFKQWASVPVRRWMAPLVQSEGAKQTLKVPNICLPYTRCNSTVLGFNEHFVQGGCPRNQFCRSGYCLCQPNYEFSSGNDGSCVLQRGIDVGQRSFLEQYFWLILVGIVAVVVVVFSLAMLQVVRSKLGSRKIVPGRGGGNAHNVHRSTAVRMSMIDRVGGSGRNNRSAANGGGGGASSSRI
ncbi:hypothetical protein TYRP_004138 [Tyrophagus putrescentiae]|nr:hypothetical protein TYRP_004138 [Tyrophagus putrescentiae]